jgi:co-chaperonin GroES (HSP10)
MAQAVKTTLGPRDDRISLKRLEERGQHRSLIIVPDTAKEKPQGGKVIAVGTGKGNDDGQNLPPAATEATESLSTSISVARSSSMARTAASDSAPEPVVKLRAGVKP